MHILVIDDDATFRMLLDLQLTQLGHSVSVAEDGIQGHSMARELVPDVIMIDYQMPLANGQVVAERIAKSYDTRHIPMILISGVGGGDVPQEIYDAGIVEVLSKLTLTEDDLDRALTEAVATTTGAA